MAEETMSNGAQAPGNGSLGVRDEEFWTDPLRQRDALEGPLFERGADVALLDGPARVPLAARQTCPVAVLRVAPLQKLEDLPFQRHAVIVLADRDTGAVAAALFSPPDPDAIELPRPGMAPLEGAGSEVYLADLRALFDLPWRPARYRLTLILRDERAGGIGVELVEGDGRYEDPEVLRYKEAQRQIAPPPPIHPPAGAALPRYTRDQGSPDLPEGCGIAIAAPRVVDLAKGPARIVRGSFRLPVPRSHALEGSAAEGDRPVTAVVPISLVITGSSTPSPVVCSLVVPSFEPVDMRGDRPIATGWFTIDLAQLGASLATPQTYFVYVFSRDAVAGPAPMAVCVI